MWGNYTNDGLLEMSHFPVLVWKIYHLQCHDGAAWCSLNDMEVSPTSSALLTADIVIHHKANESLSPP
jgi:hypothetical protein